MSIVLDYTARIAPASLHAADVSGVCRYISLPQTNTQWKRITLTEYRELVAAGIDVTLNWEYSATDWLGGAARGKSHGEEAVRQAKALGYPAGKVLVGSADFNMTAGDWDRAGAGYAQAFAAAVRAGGYRPGVYGPWDVLTWVRDAGIMDAFWQAGMSTSWSGGRNKAAWPGAHLRQRAHKTVGGVDTDWNEILIPNWGDDMPLTADEHAEIVEGDLTPGNVLHYRLRAILDGSDPQLQEYFNKGWDQPVGLKQLAEKIDALPASSGGQPTQDQVDTAVLKALRDPEVQAGLGRAFLAALKG